MAKQIVQGARLYDFTEAGSMGVVTDTLFLNCFWPRSEKPFSPFAKGSSGIEIQGPPTPRNIVFPGDTKAVDGTRLDCHFESEQVVEKVEKIVTVTEDAVIKGETREVNYKEAQQVDRLVRKVTPVKVDAAADLGDAVKRQAFKADAMEAK